MGTPGLTPFLLTLGFLALALPAPPRPLCDQRVMDKFIQDAGKLENEILELCSRASCSLPEHVTVLDTRVNFPAWNAMDRSRQASEVWRGQSLLSTAILHVKSQQPVMQPFLHQLEVVESSLRSIREILRGHGAQAAPQDEISPRTLTVQTVNTLFSMYSSFLRGKVNLFITGACKGNSR